MSDPLAATLQISGAGLRAQSERLRVVSENLANARSTGKRPEMIPTSARPSHLKASSAGRIRPISSR